MEFYIKKNSTLPILKLQVVKDGRSDYNKFMRMIEESAIFFSMVNVETGIPKIITRPAGFVEKVQLNPDAEPEYYIYYQFKPKEVNKVGRFTGQFLLRNDEGTLILPIREELFINIQESFIADDLPYESCYVSEFPCCVSGVITVTPTPLPSQTPTPTPTSGSTPTPTPTPTLTPTPTPITEGIYYGKINSPSITLPDVSGLTFVATSSAVDSYVEFTSGLGYGYTLIPDYFAQPTEFRNSALGCSGYITPTNLIGQITITNIYMVSTTYNVYRTYYAFVGPIYNWMCS